jgi:hypothetical protein
VALDSYRLVKFLSIILCLIILTASAEIKESPKKTDEVKTCTKWQWTGDVYNRIAHCVEWTTKDCSQRLHKEICKLGG